MLTKPRWLLHLEGAALFAMAVYFYAAGHFRWWLFVLLFFTPDLFMLGFLVNVRWGSALYNLVHTTTGPLLLVLVSHAASMPQLFPYALMWAGHIGFDRMLGYGLKYPTRFKDTHFERL
jgi:hypothetical protein